MISIVKSTELSRLFCLALALLVWGSRPVGESRVEAALPQDSAKNQQYGILHVSGQHLTLYSDVSATEESRQELHDLVAAFDAAVPQWGRYFEIDPVKMADWKMKAYVMLEPERFRRAGMLPNDLPEFPAGYQRGDSLWVYRQPGDYYTRHLLLHEGTHGFMETFLGSFGSPWYAEGMAEMLGLHSWQPDLQPKPKIQLNARIQDRSETPYWGRVKILKQAAGQNKIKSLDEVVDFPGRAFRDVESYAWAWAACKFFSEHPLSQSRFRELAGQLKQSRERFDGDFKQTLMPHWAVLERDWQLMLHEIDYGYEVHRGILIPAKILAPLSTDEGEGAGMRGSKNEGQDDQQRPGNFKIEIKSDHAWQTTSIAVHKGDRVRIRSTTRFQVAHRPPPSGGSPLPWPCEPNGITIQFYRGQPLGVLLAGVLSDESKNDTGALAGLLSPTVVGRDSTLEISQNGSLCLRINESPAWLDDNQGTLQVTVEKLE